MPCGGAFVIWQMAYDNMAKYNMATDSNQINASWSNVHAIVYYCDLSKNTRWEKKQGRIHKKKNSPTAKTLENGSEPGLLQDSFEIRRKRPKNFFSGLSPTPGGCCEATLNRCTLYPYFHCVERNAMGQIHRGPLELQVSSPCAATSPRKKPSGWPLR